MQDGCILWGNCVVIPPPGCQKVIDELYAAYPGISRMKSLARSYVWWHMHGMDEDLETKVTVPIDTKESASNFNAELGMASPALV